MLPLTHAGGRAEAALQRWTAGVLGCVSLHVTLRNARQPRRTAGRARRHGAVCKCAKRVRRRRPPCRCAKSPRAISGSRASREGGAAQEPRSSTKGWLGQKGTQKGAMTCMAHTSVEAETAMAVGDGTTVGRRSSSTTLSQRNPAECVRGQRDRNEVVRLTADRRRGEGKECGRDCRSATKQQRTPRRPAIVTLARIARPPPRSTSIPWPWPDGNSAQPIARGCLLHGACARPPSPTLWPSR